MQWICKNKFLLTIFELHVQYSDRSSQMNGIHLQNGVKASLSFGLAAVVASFAMKFFVGSSGGIGESGPRKL
jgi:hypothetical protein